MEKCKFWWGGERRLGHNQGGHRIIYLIEVFAIPQRETHCKKNSEQDCFPQMNTKLSTDFWGKKYIFITVMKESYTNSVLELTHQSPDHQRNFLLILGKSTEGKQIFTCGVSDWNSTPPLLP